MARVPVMLTVGGAGRQAEAYRTFVELFLGSLSVGPVTRQAEAYRTFVKLFLRSLSVGPLPDKLKRIGHSLSNFC